jgi:hypothetical protein
VLTRTTPYALAPPRTLWRGPSAAMDKRLSPRSQPQPKPSIIVAALGRDGVACDLVGVEPVRVVQDHHQVVGSNLAGHGGRELLQLGSLIGGDWHRLRPRREPR